MFLQIENWNYQTTNIWEYLWMNTQIAMMPIESKMLSFIAERKIGYQWKIAMVGCITYPIPMDTILGVVCRYCSRKYCLEFTTRRRITGLLCIVKRLDTIREHKLSHDFSSLFWFWMLRLLIWDSVLLLSYCCSFPLVSYLLLMILFSFSFFICLFCV